MWDAQNDTTAIYAETNKDYVSTLQRRFFRPPFIQPVRCKKVKIEGVKIVNSPFWTVNPEFCDNVTIKGITINNVPSPNTDGINPESCRNVHISDCHISVGDDCITINPEETHKPAAWECRVRILLLPIVRCLPVMVV